MPGATVHRLPVSEQVEQASRYEYLEASDGDVDLYVDDASPEILGCRLKGHDYPEDDPRLRSFTDVDDDGLLVRELLCARCQAVARVERWEERGRGRNRRLRLVGVSSIRYGMSPDGKQYRAPAGIGRITRRRVRESIVTKSLAGKTAKQIRRDIAAAKKEEAAS